MTVSLDWLERVRTRGTKTEKSRPDSLADLVDDTCFPRAGAVRRRIGTLLRSLDLSVPAAHHKDLISALEAALADLRPEEVWLAVSVLTARFANAATVNRTVRMARLDGALVALFDALRRSGQLDASAWPEVEVVVDRVLVDLHHTARSPFATGIQRVARELARRWVRDHDVVLLGWTEGYTGLRRLSATEVNAALTNLGNDRASREVDEEAVIVPWRCTHLVAELPVEPHRTTAYQSFVRFSRSITGLVGHDCVPIMAAETTAEGMPIGFANYLAMVADADRMAVTCQAAETEFRGWRRMLAGAGKVGPEIRCVPLSVHAELPTDAGLHEARELFCIGSLPVVLAVGSHEPRKNHLALLHAAEVLWRQGLLFNLVLVGGNSWNSAEFDAQVELLRHRGRPVQAVQALSDDLLWAAYRLAYCVVFPSLHEGFGLPVAESLASGTPVITSGFGSMRELSRSGGAILIDPRSDTELTNALRRLLLDATLRRRLASDAAKVTRRSWDDYAADVWSFLVEGQEPGVGSTAGS
jgi:glycosyltransferase involved in cell wall biosynthesis